jgi:hypothetical protein
MSDFLDLHDDRALRRVLFLCAILLIFVPFLQAGSQLWPMQLSNIQWRFGAANALSAVLLLPFLGLSLLLVIARSVESSSIAKSVGAIAGLFTVALAASFVVFILDALQLKTIVSTQMEAAFKTTSARVGLTTLLFMVAYLVLALAGFKSPRAASTRSAPARSTGRARSDDEGDDSSPVLIVGR